MSNRGVAPAGHPDHSDSTDSSSPPGAALAVSNRSAQWAAPSPWCSTFKEQARDGCITPEVVYNRDPLHCHYWHDGKHVSIPHGFEYLIVGDEVELRHHGQRATALRGAAAARFLADVDTGDPQEIMARATGNYKHGNERRA